MTPREELIALRRLQELEAKAGQASKPLVMPDGTSAVDAGKRLQDDAKFWRDNDPTRDMNTAELVAAGVGKSIVDTGRGIQQLTGNRSRAQVDADRAVDAPLMRRGAGVAGNVGGTVAQIVAPGGLLKLGASVPRLSRAAPAMRASSQAFLPNIPGVGARVGAYNVLANAGQGAAFSAIQPVGTGESRLQNTGTGAVFGGAGALVPRVMGWGARGVTQAATSHTERGALNRAVQLIQSEASNPNSLLTANPSLIPNVRRTLFDESQDAGVARLETRARGNGLGWPELDSQNNAARASAIGAFAGDEASIAAAEAARTERTGGLLSAALEPVGNQSEKVLRRALGMRVPDDVDVTPVRSLLDSGISSNAPRQPVQQALQDVRKSLDNSSNDVASLYKVRKNIGDLLEGKAGSDKSYAQAATRELMQIKNQLDEQLRGASPAFGNYLDEYIAGSKPINRMELGQSLLDSGTGKIRDPSTGAYRLMPGAFGGQVKNLDALAAKATGFKKATAANILEPADFATIGAVEDDLSRSAQRLIVGAGGNSHTASQQELGKRLGVKALARVVPGVNAAVEFLEQAGAKRLQSALDQVLQDPNKYREISMRLSSSDRRLLQQAINRVGGTAGTAMFPSVE